MDTSTPLELDPARRLAWRGGAALALGGRAFDLLLTLAEKPGEFIAADALMQRVWPSRSVEPNNLRMQVQQLRQRLGPKAVEWLAARGYRLMLPVRPHSPAGNSGTGNTGSTATSGISGHRLLGRDSESAQLAALAAQQPLLTVLGAGGIGKTALVRAWFDTLPSGPAQAKAWVDLSGTQAGAVLPALATALGFSGTARRWTAQDLATELQQRRGPKAAREHRLVLDNAEPVVEALAPVLADLLAALPQAAAPAADGSCVLRVVVTSQLPLRLPQEHLLRLGPLDLPEPGAALAQARRHAAVQLFVERVRALQPAFDLDEARLPAVVALCHSLDGVPLALELAAARVPALGVHALAQSLDQRLRLLATPAHGRPGRQQTLRATLDWICQLLHADTRTVFERLGVFSSPFTLLAAQAVACDEPGEGPIDAAMLTDAIGLLADASLLAPQADGSKGSHATWRLLDTPRLYALHQLQQHDQLDALRRRHLAWCLRWVQGADAPRLAQGQAELQAALDWALSGGDSAGGAALAEHLAAHPGLAALRDQARAQDAANDSLPRLLDRLRAAGLDRHAEQAGLDRRSLLAMAHRLRPAEARSVDDALQELEQAVELARAALAPAADEPSADAFVDGVLSEVSEHTRLGEFNLGSECVDDALAELDRREARRRAALQRSQRVLLNSGLQQDLLRRDAAAVARRTEALLALDEPQQPTQGRAWLDREAAALERGRSGVGTLWLEVAVALARHRLVAAPTARARAEAGHALAQALTLLGDRTSSADTLAAADRAGQQALAECPSLDAPGMPGWAALRGALQRQRAEVLLMRGQRQGSAALLNEGLQQAEAALAAQPRHIAPLDWAAAQHLRGDLLRCLGLQEMGLEKLHQAEAALREALAERDPARHPGCALLDRARTLNALGIVLSVIGTRTAGADRHRESLALQQAALALVPRETAPTLWGRICNNIGLEHSLIAGLGIGEEEVQWRAAIEAYRRALEVLTRDAATAIWARIHHNLGCSLSHLGNRLGDNALLAQAIPVFRAALLEHTREQQPLVWSATATELANALHRLGYRTPGPEGRAMIEESLVILKATLQVRRRDVSPLDWARNQGDIADAQLHLGQHSGEADWVRRAIETARLVLDWPEMAERPMETQHCTKVSNEALQWLAAQGQPTA